ncbi:MAG: putative molybdenum carrier protein [Candidatus Thiodiazotropha sp. (ex Monitilora ramsayi)]|nr:putative molybdenum carrier protein [Candidatus Thiodiazotropha sp. (ex Monitilora ramsayi)]
MKIVSGAQTGVDRAALDAALESHNPAGGWCPQGRTAEDGIIPEIYPVTELPNAGYRERTKQNVIDSDATLIIYFATLSGGTLFTADCCHELNKPHLLIDADKRSVEDAAEEVLSFIKRHKVTVLNVAGPRASGDARAYGYAKQLVLTTLSEL